jgi:hypothetical protein
MAIQGFPISTRLPEDVGFSERFWYWRGASGRNYIHSIYAAARCPPLPGAVYVAVRGHGRGRRAIATGRFPSFWEGSIKGLAPTLDGVEADEIHVHLLARNDEAAEAVSEDLVRALGQLVPSVDSYRGVAALAAA